MKRVSLRTSNISGSMIMFPSKYAWALSSAILFAALSVSLHPAAAQAPGSALPQDCGADVQRFCRAITPGEGRVVACLISHSDKIAPRCRLTAFLAGKALADNLVRLDRLAFDCGADIKSLCFNIHPGGGRVYDCLRKNRAKLLPSCRQAMPKFEAEYLLK
jgi:hypothetical protein